ncbi:hypothetical protein OROHE_022962 [Orobanche hederae]
MRGLHCPLRSFHCCPDARDGCKGISRLVSHLKTLHMCSDERKNVIRNALENDCDLFTAFEESLRGVGQWLCGRCMGIHAMSRACHHPDGLVRVPLAKGGVGSHIVGIVKPSATDSVKLAANDVLVWDARLLERVLKAPISTVKSIPLSCRLAFSQILIDALYKAVADPGSVGAWVRLLLLPRCTLRVVKPLNRRDRRSANRRSLQQHHILECLATWRDTDGAAKLVASVLESSTVTRMEEKDKKLNSNVKQCLRKVADGHFTAAVKVLGSSGVAPYNEHTIKALEEKHPYRPSVGI